MFLGYFLAGQFEELGWSGYAIDPLQDRWNALRAAILLASVWAAFHSVPLLQRGRSAGWIAWWSLITVALRVLITWIYTNTGKSVFAARCCTAWETSGRLARSSTSAQAATPTTLSWSAP
jgi:uncharacterized protein